VVRASVGGMEEGCGGCDVLTQGLVTVTGSRRAFVLSGCGCEFRGVLWKRKAVSDRCGSCEESTDVRDSGGHPGEHPCFWGLVSLAYMFVLCIPGLDAYRPWVCS
jgi:hypothetical protein